MAGLTKYGEQMMLQHLLGQVAFTMPSNVYMVLFLEDPTEDGVYTDEVANTGGYGRIDITTLLGAWSITGIANNVIIDFGTASSEWGEIKYAGVSDSPTHGSGNLLAYEAMLNNVTVFDTDPFYYRIGRFNVSID